jgi:hypothetical protein
MANKLGGFTPGGHRNNGNGHHPEVVPPKPDEPVKFHPLADAYPMLAEADLAVLAADIKANGLISKIVLHEGMILDGRNRELACKLAGVEPQYRLLPEGRDPTAWVESANEHRRHLSQEWLQKRREERVKEVARRRQRGESYRNIAESLEISETQVRRDIQDRTAPPGAVEPRNGVVKGRDGKERSAKKKGGKKAESPDPTPTRGDAHEPPPQPQRNADGAILKDCLGQVIPQRLRDIFAQTVLTKVTERLAAAANEVANARRQLSGAMAAWAVWVPPGVLDDLLKIAEGEDGLTVIAESVANSTPYCVCPRCKGDDSARETCQHCMAGSGWWPKSRHDMEGGVS